MSDAIRQVVKKDLKAGEKWKEFGLVMAAIVLFYAVYFFSSLIGYFALIGYLADIGILYLLYRCIRQYSYRYTYVVSNGTLAVVQSEGRRNAKQLCLLQLDKAIGLYVDAEGLAEPDRLIMAARSNEHKDNRWLLVRQDRKNTLLCFTPNETILTVVRAYTRQKETGAEPEV